MFATLVIRTYFDFFQLNQLTISLFALTEESLIVTLSLWLRSRINFDNFLQQIYKLKVKRTSKIR